MTEATTTAAAACRVRAAAGLLRRSFPALCVLLVLLTVAVAAANASTTHVKKQSDYNALTGSDPVFDCIANALGTEVAQSTLWPPGTTPYNDTVNIDNARVVVLPAAAMLPRNAQDVSAGMAAAERCRVRFSVISGGHSAAGYGLVAGGLTINMQSINASTFVSSKNDGTDDLVTIGSGSRFVEVYTTLKRRNRGEMIVGGGCPQEAVGGFTLGGGWSFLSRSYGLGIDVLVGVTMVLPNRTVVQLDASSPDSELWWALRGGGGGNFGVVTHFTTKLFRPEPRSTIGDICWPEFAEEEIVNAMQWWITNFDRFPDWLDLDPAWLPIGSNHTRVFCFTTICNSVSSNCEPWLTPLVDGRVANAKPFINTLKVQQFVDFSLANSNVTSAQHDYLYLKSFMYTRQKFTAETVRLLIAALRLAPSARNLVLFHVGGGAIGRVASNATAFPHRDVFLMLQVKAIWSDPADERVNMRWIDSIATKVSANVTGAYVNYIDARLEDWQQAYYGTEGYQRLLQVKRRVDPDDLFRFHQSIGAA